MEATKRAEIGTKSEGRIDESSDGDTFNVDEWRRSEATRWVRMVEKGYIIPNKLPPLSLVLYPDLVKRGYGWDRLVPYPEHPCIDWPDYKKYLEEYFRQNQTSKADDLCALLKSLPNGEISVEDNTLHYLANMCVKIENKLLTTYFGELTREDIGLFRQIKDRARHLIQSKVESCIATASLMCITLDTELLYQFMSLKHDKYSLVPLSKEIRRSASNFMLCEGSEYATAAAAMLGIAVEALRILQNPEAFGEFFICDLVRRNTAAVLTKLEQEFFCKTAGIADGNNTPAIDTSEKAIGAVKDINSEGSEPMGHSEKDMGEQGITSKMTRMKRNENLSNQVEAGEDKLNINENVTKLSLELLRTRTLDENP